MDSKKAFTLIELLAVIVILAIVLSIAAVAISGTIENSRNESFKASLSAAARKISYEVSQGGPSTGTLENLNLQGDKLSGFYVYDYIKGQVIFGKNTRNDTTETCINTTNYLNGIQNSNIVKCSTLSKGLIGHWKLDGNTSDDTIFNNNGVKVGLIADDSNRFGGSAKSMLMNTSGPNYIDCGINLPVLDKMTISGWINIPVYPTSQGGIVTNTPAVGQFNYMLGITTDGYPFASYKAAAFNQLQHLTRVSLNTWYNLTMVVDATNLTLYINGGNPQTMLKGSVSYSNYNTLIGVFRTNQFVGKIDDIRIYNRALSPAEVLELYNTVE